jgi:hypothetical protein
MVSSQSIPRGELYLSDLNIRVHFPFPWMQHRTLPPLLAFEQQPTRSPMIITHKLKNEQRKKDTIDAVSKLREQESKISDLEKQLSDLQFRYQHIQNLLSETDQLVASQQREIGVLKHALTQHQTSGTPQEISRLQAELTKSQREREELYHRNSVLVEQLARLSGGGLLKADSVELNVDTQTASKLKRVMDSPRITTRGLSPELSMAPLSPEVTGLPHIQSVRSSSPVRSRLNSAIDRRTSSSSPSANFAHQFHEPSPPHTEQGRLPSFSSLKEQLSALGSLLEESHDEKSVVEDKSLVEQIFKSGSKEFIVETPLTEAKAPHKRSLVRVREPGESESETGFEKRSVLSSVRLSDQAVDKNLQDKTRELRAPQWIPSQNEESLVRSPSPTKSMLIRERDDLEEELLAQYGRLRKLESMESILKSLTHGRQ